MLVHRSVQRFGPARNIATFVALNCTEIHGTKRRNSSEAGQMFNSLGEVAQHPLMNPWPQRGSLLPTLVIP